MNKSQANERYKINVKLHVHTSKTCQFVFHLMSLLVGKQTMWFKNRSDTNWPVQAQKQARNLKFWIYKVEELYFPCSENKGADQLRGYREADLRLCFCICRLFVFSRGGSNYS